jgi:1,4-alpha-glucan branching enzyme
MSGLLRLPAPAAAHVEVRFAPLFARDRFDPPAWPRAELARDPAQPGWFQLDLDALGLDDGVYEYEFILDDRHDRPIPDPYAEELTRFGGYRGLFRIQAGRRFRPPFDWSDELPPGVTLPGNHQIVIYELPLRWTTASLPDAADRQIGLGDFDHLIFQHLDALAALGVNAIELLPVQDSPDTVNWGYGTRFFFCPDIDLGAPLDFKLFVKRCHQRGMRVLLDLVMNHAKACPLEALADDWYFLKDGAEEGGRDGWGGRLFRYRRPAPDGSFPARDFHFQVAAFLLREFHLDGFRLDEFKGIDNWDFVQDFTRRAHAAHQALFPGRPFIVIAEDSWTRAAAVHPAPGNPNGQPVVDALWNFAYRDEARRFLRNLVHTEWGQPARSERLRAALTGRQLWDDWDHRFKPGFADLAQSVIYTTSHDVEREGEQRFMNYVLGDLLRLRWLGSGSVAEVRALVARLEDASPAHRAAHAEALDRAGSAFALLLTAAGLPMFLAGEEFGDVHDLEHTDWRLKMSDPVDWSRRGRPGHADLQARASQLIRLRTAHPALHRNDLEFFYFHPEFDQPGGARVAAYCRPGSQPLGGPGQVVVFANLGPHAFPEFLFPCPWAAPGAAGASAWTEHGAPPAAPPARFPPAASGPAPLADVPLGPFQVRVFTT